MPVFLPCPGPKTEVKILIKSLKYTNYLVKRRWMGYIHFQAGIFHDSLQLPAVFRGFSRRRPVKTTFWRHEYEEGSLVRQYLRGAGTEFGSGWV
jgi:hypothetical protein